MKVGLEAAVRAGIRIAAGAARETRQARLALTQGVGAGDAFARSERGVGREGQPPLTLLRRQLRIGVIAKTKQRERARTARGVALADPRRLAAGDAAAEDLVDLEPVAASEGRAVAGARHRPLTGRTRPGGPRRSAGA